MKTKSITKFKYYIFSDDLKQLNYFKRGDKSELYCRYIEIVTEGYNLKKELLDNCNVNIAAMDFLSNNKVVIIAYNYKKLKNISEVKVVNKEVISNFRATMFPRATMELLNLNIEIEKINNRRSSKKKEPSKIRQKRKLAQDLTTVIFNEFLNSK